MKIAEYLQRLIEKQVPAPNLCLPEPAPTKPSELWSMAQDILKMYPAGSSGRERIVGVFLTRIKEDPALIDKLHPATSHFHYELVHAIMIHPNLTEELRNKMLKNTEITATLL